MTLIQPVRDLFKETFHEVKNKKTTVILVSLLRHLFHEKQKQKYDSVAIFEVRRRKRERTRERSFRTDIYTVSF